MTIDELATRAGTTVRNVRFYIAEGLLPRPDGAGRAASYGEEHVVRLRSILRMRETGLPLAQIRRAMAGVPAAELDETRGTALDYIDRLLGNAPAARDAAAAAAVPPPPMPAPAAAPAPRVLPMQVPAELMDERGAPAGEQWRRIRIHPDVELHLREPVPPGLASRLPQVLERLRRLLEGKE